MPDKVVYVARDPAPLLELCLAGQLLAGKIQLTGQLSWRYITRPTAAGNTTPTTPGPS